MRTPLDLFKANVQSISLNVLIFGPSPTATATDPHALDLLGKRNDLRAALLNDGHDVKFGEDLVDPSLPAPAFNPYLQELLLLSDFDVVIALIYTPGTIAELGMLERAAGKAHLFLCKQFEAGLVYHRCALLRDSFKARLSLYLYPSDVVDCNLLKLARATVADVQVAKFLSP